MMVTRGTKAFRSNLPMVVDTAGKAGRGYNEQHTVRG